MWNLETLALVATTFSSFTLPNVVAIIVGVAALASAITIIWNFLDKAKQRQKETIQDILIAHLDKYDEKVELRISNAYRELDTHTSSRLEKLEGRLAEYIKEDKDYKNIKDLEFMDLAHLLKSSHIEVYKNQIRNIYYKLRETGIISDYDKSYIDKIFPLYIAMGGNSDIQAKYKEICDIYGRITKENFDKARKSKGKPND